MLELIVANEVINLAGDVGAVDHAGVGGARFQMIGHAGDFGFIDRHCAIRHQLVAHQHPAHAKGDRASNAAQFLLKLPFVLVRF